MIDSDQLTAELDAAAVLFTAHAAEMSVRMGHLVAAARELGEAPDGRPLTNPNPRIPTKEQPT